jgi:hypothetical protein
MTWTDIEKRWHEAVHEIAAHWPETDPALLRRIEGDLSQLAEHLAQTHDLTTDEALDAIEDWIALVAARLRA